MPLILPFYLEFSAISRAEPRVAMNIQLPKWRSHFFMAATQNHLEGRDARVGQDNMCRYF